MRRIAAFALVLFVLSCTATGFAQNATTSIRGTVRDPSGAVVPGATVTLENKSAGQKLTATSKGSGEYQLQQIPPAKYLITVTATGFGAQSKVAELLVNQPATVDFSLTVSESNVVVDVTAAAQTLNTTDSSLGGSTDNATIQALPSETRNVPDLLSLQPGVLYLPDSNDSRSGSVNGGRSDQGNITLDGVDDNDQVNGYAFTGVLRETQDSVEEFRVTTSNATADAGRSSGAQVSLLTKSGTNKYHGAGYEYYRPTNTVSNNYFNKQGQINTQAACFAALPTGASSAQIAACNKEGNRPPKVIRNIYGADVGGFLIKNKLFFFGNYEAQHLREDSIVTRTTPTASYQQGNLAYTDASGNVETLTPGQVTTLDSTNGCSVCNTAAYPSGPGPNPNALAYFQSMPAANGLTEGDGLTTGSYTFASPLPTNLNTSIARLDYTPSSKHRIFVRGNLQKDVASGVEQFPGQAPSSATVDNSKGVTAGYTWTITPNLVNDLRYGFVRQGTGSSGVGSGDYVDFRFIDTATAETRSSVNIVPVNNVIDNFTILKGKHSIEFGVNWRLVHQNRTSDANSFSSGTTNPYWLKQPPPDPGTLSGGIGTYGDQNSYEIAYANLVGTVPQVTNVFNYAVSSPTTGALLGEGVPISRHFKANEYEGFIQDSWRVFPNFTVTAGVRYTVLQTPYETKGQEVIPFVAPTEAGGASLDTHSWYLKRESEALQGNVYEPDLQFSPGGKFYNKPGFYAKSKNNVAPRLALVYSPEPKTSIRLGAGIYYDHFGEGLVNIFDQEGEFGLSTSVSNPANLLTYSNSPRFTGRNKLPFSNASASATAAYPFTPCDNPFTCGFAITWGLDSKMKTPYSTSYDASLQHEFSHGYTVEIAYVGRYGTHLLQSLDLAEPVDYVDPQGGGDYYTAMKKLSQLADASGGPYSTASVQAIPYFEDVFPFMAGQAGVGTSATQSIYSLEVVPNRYGLGETGALADIDIFCVYTDAAGNCPQSKFWQNQFSSLYALSSIGKSSYNAAQWTLRHPTSHGLTVDLSYTFSKSLDWGSDAERNTEFTGQLSTSSILNTWKPYLNKAVSDFDTHSLITLDWVYDLPAGKGRAFLSKSNTFVNALLGGWQSSGIFRMTSGLPWSVAAPGWATNWQIESYGVVTDPTFHTQKHIDANQNPQYFSNPVAVNNGVDAGGPIRLPYAGEAGQRNQFRGDGYIDLDSGLTKSWQLENFGSLKFAWEVYNVTNTNRFDPASIQGGLTGSTLGTAGKLIGGTQAPRRMQFALRYDF